MQTLYSPAMQISNYYVHYSFLHKLIVFTLNQHENICIAGLNRQAGYATDHYYHQVYRRQLDVPYFTDFFDF